MFSANQTTQTKLPMEKYSLVVALYDFRTKTEGRLPLQAGDLVRVVKKHESGWWLGSLEDASTGQLRSGWFPASFVRESATAPLSRKSPVSGQEDDSQRFMGAALAMPTAQDPWLYRDPVPATPLRASKKEPQTQPMPFGRPQLDTKLDTPDPTIREPLRPDIPPRLQINSRNRPTHRPTQLQKLLHKNRMWAERMTIAKPNFFKQLATQQSPKILWIGCSDSRVPASQIMDLSPGEVFVLRNIANVFLHTDVSAQSVLQYAVEVLKVRHIIVCGHYGCGGVAASMDKNQMGLIDNWLRNIRDVARVHRLRLEAAERHALETFRAETMTGLSLERDVASEARAYAKRHQLDLLCELNVAASLQNVCQTAIVQNAWARGQELSVHGWCYQLSDGLIRDLDVSVCQRDQVEKVLHISA